MSEVALVARRQELGKVSPETTQEDSSVPKTAINSTDSFDGEGNR